MTPDDLDSIPPDTLPASPRPHWLERVPGPWLAVVLSLLLWGAVALGLWGWCALVRWCAKG